MVDLLAGQRTQRSTLAEHLRLICFFRTCVPDSSAVEMKPFRLVDFLAGAKKNLRYISTMMDEDMIGKIKILNCFATLFVEKVLWCTGRLKFWEVGLRTLEI